jgi:O-antigen ligase
MFAERPILGYAPIANKYVLGGRLPEQHHERRDAHNLFLEVMTATGIIGLIPFMVGLWLPWRAAWRARRGPAGVLPLALLVTALTANMSGNWLAGPLLWVLLAYALASSRSPAIAPDPVVARRSPVPRAGRVFQVDGEVVHRC